MIAAYLRRTRMQATLTALETVRALFGTTQTGKPHKRAARHDGMSASQLIAEAGAWV